MKDRPQTLFCNMYEWQTGTKISSMDKGSKLTYLEESTTYDTEQMGLVLESWETKLFSWRFHRKTQTIATYYLVQEEEDF